MAGPRLLNRSFTRMALTICAASVILPMAWSQAPKPPAPRPPEPERPEPPRAEPARPEPARPEPPRFEPARPEPGHESNVREIVPPASESSPKNRDEEAGPGHSGAAAAEDNTRAGRIQDENSHMPTAAITRRVPESGASAGRPNVVIAGASAIASAPPPPVRRPGQTTARVGTEVALPTSPEAEAALQRIKTERAGLRGINALPVPAGHAMVSPKGYVTVNAGPSGVFRYRPDGTLAAIRRPSENATFLGNGAVRTLHTPKLSVKREAHGARVITAQRAAGQVLVSTGRHSGYVESTAAVDGRKIYLRTYLAGNRTYRRTYLEYRYNGETMRRYLPTTVYSPELYSWAFTRWTSPIRYRWIWGGQRWYVYYRPYFVFWPSYNSADYWLADYVLGDTLQDGYAMVDSSLPGEGAADGGANDPVAGPSPEQQEDLGEPGDAAGPVSSDDVPVAKVTTSITPELKQAIAREVQQQLELDNSDSSTESNTDPAQAATADAAQFLQSGYVFVVSSPLNVSQATDNAADMGTTSVAVEDEVAQPCSLMPGDVVQLVRVSWNPTSESANTGIDLLSTIPRRMPAGSNAASLVDVKASRRGDCAVGIRVRVPIVALEEMENDFEARLDNGLRILVGADAPDVPGSGNLPAPSASMLETAPEPVLADLPQEPTVNPSAQLLLLQTEADQAEAQMTRSLSTTVASKTN